MAECHSTPPGGSQGYCSQEMALMASLHMKQVCKDKPKFLVKQIEEMLTNVILNAVKSQLVILVK